LPQPAVRERPGKVIFGVACLPLWLLPKIAYGSGYFFGWNDNPDYSPPKEARRQENMKIKQCKLHIETLLSTVKLTDPLHHELSLALYSVGKRSDFAHLHYHEVIKCMDNKLELERAGLIFTDAGNIHPNRTYYEANIFAFVQNLHAVCDSFPYIVFLMLGPLRYTDKDGGIANLRQSQCSWSANFLAAVVETFPLQTKLHRKLKRFMGDREFLVLKGLVNQCKHQHLVRILNNFTHLTFEKIEYFDKPVKGNKITLMDEDVDVLMKKCHNKLFPKLFILFWTLHQARIASGRAQC
jgi:hypothetical protein